MFRAVDGPNVHRDEAKIDTMRYFDVVNFARRVTAPASTRGASTTRRARRRRCTPAYNVITAPKRLMLAYDTGHRTTQEQIDEVNEWLAGELTGRNRPSAWGR